MLYIHCTKFCYIAILNMVEYLLMILIFVYIIMSQEAQECLRSDLEQKTADMSKLQEELHRIKVATC